MRHFYENRHFKNEACVALNQLVSLFYLFVARGGRKRGNRRTDRQTDGQTDKPSTVTLAAHARRGLIIESQIEGIGNSFLAHLAVDAGC